MDKTVNKCIIDKTLNNWQQYAIARQQSPETGRKS